MVAFNLWGESLVFGLFYAVVILSSCAGITIIGRSILDDLGRYPSRTPIIQLKKFPLLVLIEILALTFLIGFYHAISQVS